MNNLLSILKISTMKRSFLNIDELSLSQIRWIEYAHQLLLIKISSWFSGQVSVSDIDVPGPVSSFNSEASVTYLQEFTHQLLHSSQAPYNIQVTLLNGYDVLCLHCHLQCVSDAITLLEKFIALPFGLPIFYFQCEPSVQVQVGLRVLMECISCLFAVIVQPFLKQVAPTPCRRWSRPCIANRWLAYQLFKFEFVSIDIKYFPPITFLINRS